MEFAVGDSDDFNSVTEAHYARLLNLLQWYFAGSKCQPRGDTAPGYFWNSG